MADVDESRPLDWPSAIGAALLAQGERLDGLSRLLTAGALLGIAFAPLRVLPALISVAIAGLAQLYFAIRVGFDARLFRQLAQCMELAEMDAALVQLGLLPDGKVGRAMATRFAGARRLLRGQAMCLLIQIVCLLGVIVMRR